MDVIEKEQLSPAQAAKHWYYLAKLALLKRHVATMDLDRQRLALSDFGCGAGLFLTMLESDSVFRPEQMCGIDLAYPAPTPIGEGRIMVYPEFPPGVSYDLILLMDVLEHIDDDIGAFKNAVSKCRSGGYLFITVPALQFLWSRHDEFLGHKRRYSVNSLKKMIAHCDDLEVIQTHYFFASILPVAAILRLAKKWLGRGKQSDMRPAGSLTNRILLWILSLELQWAHHNQLAGLSVVAVCRKTQ